MNKKLKYAVILISLGFRLTISAQQMDINSAIKYALDHNFDYKKQQLERLITYEKTQEVLTSGFPKINGNLGYQNAFIQNTSVIPGEFSGKPGTYIPVQFGTKNNATASVGLQQLIFDGRYLVGVQARSAIKNLADVQVKMSERDVKELISKSFYQAVIAQSSLISLKSSKEVLDKLYTDAQKTYKQGLIEELDVERLQYNVKTLENTISQLANAAELSILALKLNMAYPMDSTLTLYYDINSFDSKVSEIKTKSAVISNGFENRDEFKLIDAGIRIKQYDLKQLKAGYLPSIYGSANYGYQSFSPVFNNFTGATWYNFGNFGVSINVPIFDGFTRKSQVTQAKLALDKSNLEKNQTMNALKLQAINSQLSLQNTISEYENQLNILKLAEKIERKTQVKYKEGIGSSYEFANAQNDRIQQYIKLLQTKLNLLINYTNYQKANGLL